MNRLIDFGSRFRILKGGKISLVVSALIGGTTLSFAAPSGGVVTSGSANISQVGNTTNIIQNTGNVTINWNKFNIASNETVNFKQPNVNSIALNRVIGNEKSIINGALNANGQVWILNSNGVLFGKNAKINTAGLLATTKNLSDEDFNAGNYNFKGSSTESVINLGEIDISDSGYATLLANKVSNEGTIKAIKGSVRLVGANEVSINLNGNSIVDLTVDKGVLDSLVENKGAIYSDGGEIYLTTNAVDELLKGVVNNEGIIEANSLDGVTGFVELFAHGGEAKIGGTITAKDGFIETSGKDFTFNDAKIEAGEWLIDPVNVTIDDNLATAIETQLGNGDVTIETETSSSTVDTSANESGTEGNIYVNSDITWTTVNKLTLSAYNDIFINAIIDGRVGSGQLALHYGQAAVNADNTSDYHLGKNGKVNLSAGENFFTKFGSDVSETVWTVISGENAITDLENIKTDYTTLSGNYVLGSDIDLFSIDNWDPIGEYNNSFKGNFDGLGHTISNITINSSGSNLGFFGRVDRATIKNIKLENINISGGGSTIGGLVASLYNDSFIKNSSISGTISGDNMVGGLIGEMYGSRVENSYSNTSINANSNYGGLIGYGNSGVVTNSFYNAQNIQINGKNGVITPYALYDSQFQDWLNNGKSLDITNYFTFNNGVYEISNLDDLKNILAFSHLQGNTFKLINNIDLISVEEFYIPFLNSNFDGNNKIISNLNINQNGNDYLGFIGRANNITIKNLGLEKINISATNSWFIGGLVAEAQELSIENSYTTGSIVGYSRLGGLIGDMDDSTIENSNSTIAISGDYRIGGLVGDMDDSTIENSYATGNIIGDYRIGGLVGDMDNSTIENSYATGNVTGDDSKIGGLVGSAASYGEDSSYIKDSYATGDVNGRDYTGGLVGENFDVTIENSYATGNVTGNRYVGGLVGEDLNGSIENSYATGNVTGNRYVGGLVGGLVGEDFYVTIENSYATGNVTGDEVVGGLVGEDLNGSIENSYATGNVTGNRYVGGLVGELVGGLVGEDLNGSIENSYATGNVTGDEVVGGLVGLNYNGTIESSYSISKVTAIVDYVGGLVGINNGGDIENSYATGEVTADNYVGGLVGFNGYGGNVKNSYSSSNVVATGNLAGGVVGYNSDSYITNSYYDKTLNQGMFDELEHGKTTTQLQNINTFKNDNSNWSIVEDSSIDKGTPILSWQVGKDGAEKPVWLIGTKVTSAEKPTTEKEIEKVITAIVNKESVKVPNPPKVKTSTLLNTGSNTNVAFNIGENKQIVSKPIEGQATKRVTLSEAKQMQQDATGQSVDEVRVPLSRSSIIQLVDGGVSLPNGVEQEFYVADNK